MSHFRFPKNKKWRGGFPGNYTGEVLYTRNMDLSKSPGRICLSDKIIKSVDTADTNMSTLLTATKFIRTNADATDRFWAVCGNDVTGGNLFKSTTNTPVGTWGVDTETSSPTNALDMEIHESANGEQRLVVTQADGDMTILNRSGVVNDWTADWWDTTLAQNLMTTGVRHPLCRLQRLLAIGDDTKIHTIDQNDVVSVSRLTIPYGYSIRNIYTSADRFWIGCTNLIGQNAKIIEWDGTSLTYNKEYDLVGPTPITGFIINNIPHFITDLGFIYGHSGGSFKPVQQFPLAEEFFSTLDISTYGTSVQNSKVLILAKDSSDSVTTESVKFRSGIWEFNAETKDLNHKHGLGATDIGALSTYPDFGQSVIAAVGGLISAPISGTNIIFAGAQIYTAYTGTALYGFFRSFTNERSGSEGNTRGYFVTPHLPIDKVEAMWQGLWAKFKRFVDSTNRIVVKARVSDPRVPVTADLTGSNSERVIQKSGTWTATTTFTCVVPTGVIVGDEVEVMNGNGAGCLFHISTLSATPDNSATITVTVDEALPSLNAGGSRGALFRFDNWIKVGTISSTTVGNQKLLLPEKLHGEFLQLKVEMRGYDMELDELIPVYKSLTDPDQL